MTYCAPVERPVHHTGLSIWFAPSAIKTGSVYTSGELSFSLCLSVSLDRSQPCLFHTHTYALTRLCHNRERLLVRHLPEYRLTDISHPAVTDDHEEQGQHLCPVLSNPVRPLTPLWVLSLLLNSRYMLTLLKISPLVWFWSFILVLQIQLSASFQNHLASLVFPGDISASLNAWQSNRQF